MTRATGGKLLLAAAIAVGAAVAAGLWTLGSPATERQKRLDSARVEDLTAIERTINAFVGIHKTLPRDLPSLTREPGFSLRVDDPESGAPYAYETLDESSYRLCAIFATRSEPAVTSTWAHDVGRQCFTKISAKPTAYDKAH